MNKKMTVRPSLTLAMLALALMTSVNVQAQSGKRICGQWAALPGGAGYAGILVEVQNGGSIQANEACDKAKSKSPSSVFGSTALAPYLASMTWTVQGTTACENVGKYFTSADHTNVDMCQYMNGYNGYAVVKMTSTNTTTYTQ